MIENAVLKINTEINQSNNNPYIKVVGEFLLRYLEINPEAAEKITNTDKTIAKSLDVMKSEAEKKKVSNCAVLTDQEGFELVLKYFDIEVTTGVMEVKTDIPNKPVEQRNEPDGFDIKLEDFLS